MLRSLWIGSSWISSENQAEWREKARSQFSRYFYLFFHKSIGIQIMRFRYYRNEYLSHIPWMNKNLNWPLNANIVCHTLWQIENCQNAVSSRIDISQTLLFIYLSCLRRIELGKCLVLFAIWWRPNRTKFSIQWHHIAASHCTTYSTISSVNSSMWKSMTMTSFVIRAVYCSTHPIVFGASSTMWSTCCNCKSNENTNWVRRRCVDWTIERRGIVTEAPESDLVVWNVHLKQILPIVWCRIVGITSTKRFSPELRRQRPIVRSPWMSATPAISVSARTNCSNHMLTSFMQMTRIQMPIMMHGQLSLIWKLMYRVKMMRAMRLLKLKHALKPPKIR